VNKRLKTRRLMGGHGRKKKLVFKHELGGKGKELSRERTTKQTGGVGDLEQTKMGG